MKLEDYMTLKEIEEKFGVQPSTIRSYIARGQVIPSDRFTRVGRTILIDREFAEEKWKKEEKI